MAKKKASQKPKLSKFVQAYRAAQKTGRLPNTGMKSRFKAAVRKLVEP